MHGANRLASNSLLEGLVFGARAAEAMVADAAPAPPRCRAAGGRRAGRRRPRPAIPPRSWRAAPARAGRASASSATAPACARLLGDLEPARRRSPPRPADRAAAEARNLVDVARAMAVRRALPRGEPRRPLPHRLPGDRRRALPRPHAARRRTARAWSTSTRRPWRWPDERRDERERRRCSRSASTGGSTPASRCSCCVLLALDLGVFHRKAHAVSVQGGGDLERRLGDPGPALQLPASTGSCCSASRTTRGSWRCPGFDAARGGARGRARVPGRLRGRVLALRRQHLRVRGGAELLRRSRRKYQHRVLFFGILGALIFRAIFIAIGAALMQYQWVIWLFGVFLVFTGVRMMFAKETGVEPEENAHHPAVPQDGAGDERAARAELLRAASTAGSTPRRSSSPCSSWR